VPPDLRSYVELLKALGVPEKFSPHDFIAVLRKLQAKSQGRPLDGYGLEMAVGMVRVLSKLSPAERARIDSEIILVPEKNGPLLLPATDLVYDDAPWLTSRLRQVNLRLVHPDVGDEVAKAVGVRGLREMFIDSQGGNQV
ncbi:unnamed protein product, partial [Sphacelaria rigidula]